MNLVFVSNHVNLKAEMEEVFREIPDLEYSLVDGETFLQVKEPENYDVVVFDGPTWQRLFSFYRFFGLNEFLETIPVMFCSKSKSSPTYKGRLGKKDVHVAVPVSPDMFQKFLDDYKLNRDLMENLARASMMVH